MTSCGSEHSSSSCSAAGSTATPHRWPATPSFDTCERAAVRRAAAGSAYVFLDLLEHGKYRERLRI